MPRSVDLFREAGFEVLPWPVFHPEESSKRHTLAVATYEWVRLIAYCLMRRTVALFLGPGRKRIDEQETIPRHVRGRRRL